jgi:transposase
LSKIRKKKRSKKQQELSFEELQLIVDRAKTAPLTDEDHQKLKAAVDTLGALTLEIEAKGASIKRLRKLIFGAPTEKTNQVVGKASDKADETKASQTKKEKRKGHGRNGAKDYKGATKVKVPHEFLEHGGPCSECLRARYTGSQSPRYWFE